MYYHYYYHNNNNNNSNPVLVYQLSDSRAERPKV